MLYTVLKKAKEAEAKKVADGKIAFKNAVKLSKSMKTSKILGNMAFSTAVEVAKAKKAKDGAVSTMVGVNKTPNPRIIQELADVVSSTLLVLAILVPSDVVHTAMQEVFEYVWDELSAQSILNTELNGAFRSILVTGLRARPLLLGYLKTVLYMDDSFHTFSLKTTPIPLDALIVYAINKM